MRFLAPSVRALLLAGLSLAAVSAARAEEPKAFDATLVHHAVLPGATFAAAPADAPAGLTVSGRYTGAPNELGRRFDALYSIYDAKTGLARPFPGQPVQGFSGIRALGDGRYLVLTDNGFGAKANSADAMLMVHVVRPDWQTGRVTVEKTTFLKDPNRVLPFRVVNEATAARYLTGADLDTESIQPVGEGFVIGDEFGPYLIAADADGVVTRYTETTVGGTTLHSPDHYAMILPASPDKPLPAFEVSRSKGYEGMAISADGKTLHPMLEGPVWIEGKKEEKGGKAVLRVYDVDAQTLAFADTVRYYPLEAPTNAIGDFNMIDETRALVIERDDGQGDPREGWAETPAKFKRIYLVDLAQTDADGVVRKIGYIDLMAIRDPNGVARAGTIDGIFTFPFQTIENVDRISETEIIVACDNNFPFSVGRAKGKADDDEFVVLEVGGLLAAR
ncbi:esterase-like activity of phytase family protein [Prosthecomicrobium pneumaticum]|uniref:Phytase-like domain-containing protein n=1 Tax=Prosthecomicrobium pneumaticum TaxID=81895 RepID=A0A7W9L371_9HYPH|nr:esterase-like activity of phytase family protein [Prosthecomicrobium pneumaticum]MBB5754252.1 hypothetical protein [Prosthecomicrobium pneumaticum]